MKVIMEPLLQCECGSLMLRSRRYDDAGNMSAPSVECGFSDCKHFGIKFALPTIELEPVTK